MQNATRLHNESLIFVAINELLMTRKETIIAIILLIIIGTSMHFVHHAPFFNHFLGYIFPVTESVMAHMKMVFYPMLLLSLFFLISRRDIREVGAPLLGGLAVMPLIIAAFFAYWIFVRHELMFLVIIIVLTGFLTYNPPDCIVFADLG